MLSEKDRIEKMVDAIKKTRFAEKKEAESIRKEREEEEAKKKAEEVPRW